MERSQYTNEAQQQQQQQPYQQPYGARAPSDRHYPANGSGGGSGSSSSRHGYQQQQGYQSSSLNAGRYNNDMYQFASGPTTSNSSSYETAYYSEMRRRHASSSSTGSSSGGSGVAAYNYYGTNHGGSSFDSDKSVGYMGGPSGYPHGSGTGTGSEPIVQTVSKLNEEARRVHCYISDDVDSLLEDESIQQPMMVPPTLRPMARASELPFWRPPAVMQSDPHYHTSQVHSRSTAARQARLAATARQRQRTSRQIEVGVGAVADNRTVQNNNSTGAIGGQRPISVSSASPLPYFPQQHSQQLQPARASRNSMPTINSLLTSPPPPMSVPQSSAIALPSIHALTAATSSTAAGKMAQTNRPLDFIYETGGGLAVDDGEDDDDEDDEADGGAFHGFVAPRGAGRTPAMHHEMRLPPLHARHQQEKTAMGPPATQHQRMMLPPPPPPPLSPGMAHSGRYSAGEKTRESMSISALVGGTCAAPSRRSEPNISLPGIASLAAAAAVVSSSRTTQPTQLASAPMLGESRKRAYEADADTSMVVRKAARIEPLSRTDVAENSSLCATNQVAITCYHAAVAQKSYGGEKRFLCPPPAVLMTGGGRSARTAHHSPMVLSVTTDGTAGPSAVPPPAVTPAADKKARASSSAHAPLECHTTFNSRNVALFKSLHVTGMQKAKSFRLRLDLLAPAAGVGAAWAGSGAYASLESDPVAIISKPSKKTAKARNQASCIRGGSLVSLFNRINSQTFRTKYLNVDHASGRWVAQSHNWSPFKVVVVSRPPAASATAGAADAALYYGAEIVLVETRRNFTSPVMVIRKVERGRLVPDARSPVSQMQKVALQLKPHSPHDEPRFLKADVGHYSQVSDPTASAVRFDDPDGSPELTFESIAGALLTRTRSRDLVTDSMAAANQGVEIDDFFCWTIVGIAGFSYSFSLPKTHSHALPVASINPIPRVIGTPSVLGRQLRLTVNAFEPKRMRVVVGDARLPLPVEVNAGAKGDGIHLVASVPLACDDGVLAVLRDDGVLFHLKWRLACHAAKLQVDPCHLDI